MVAGSIRHRHALALAVALTTALTAARADASNSAIRQQRTCDGDTISAVIVRSRPASSAGLAAGTQQATTKFLGIPITSTRPNVVRAYLRLAVGRLCTEIDRRESERLLRAQPFLASATVRAIPETPGRVRVLVDVTDELPLILDARLRRGTLSSLLLGTHNVAGRGLSLAANAERGFAYRDGFGARFTKYGLLGRPAFLSAHAERRAVIGERLVIELAEPFLTDLQRRAFHASAGLQSGYSGILPPSGEEASVFVRRTSYDVGVVTRVGRANGRGAVGLFGAALIGEDVRSGDDLVIVSDTGIVAGPRSPFGTYYPDFTITRLAAIGGLRALRFATVRGFDALTAEQDLGSGVQLDVLVGPSLSTSGHARDVLVASDLYAGAGSAQSFFVARALMEARRDRGKLGWDGVVASGRLSWYGKPSSERTRLASIDLSAVHGSVFPLQLTFRDTDGGLPGFGNATFAGGQRIVARLEERLLVHTFGTRVDFAVGAFASAGKLWAGDVPYGRTTNVRAAAGVSLLGAFPSGGKRTYRLDLVVPFNPERGGSRVELRLAVRDRTRLLWLEPNDVARARTGAVPVSLMKW